eukprot:9395798-Alexandrium_andersonii.AAC.1
MLLSSSLLSAMSTSFSGSACLSGRCIGGSRSGSSCSTCASSVGFGRASVGCVSSRSGCWISASGLRRTQEQTS